jgi:Arm DNA-binding domain
MRGHTYRRGSTWTAVYASTSHSRLVSRLPAVVCRTPRRRGERSRNWSARRATSAGAIVTSPAITEPGDEGKRRQRSKGGFPTRKDAQRFPTDQLAQIDSGGYAAPSKLTLGEYLTGSGCRPSRAPCGR